MARKAKNMCQRCTFLGGGSSGVMNMAQPSLGNLGAKFSETHSLNLRLVLHKLAIVSLREQFKTFDSNNFTLSSMFSFQNVWPIKRKAVYTLLLFHIYLFIFLVTIGLDHNFLFYTGNLFFYFY